MPWGTEPRGMGTQAKPQWQRLNPYLSPRPLGLRTAPHIVHFVFIFVFGPYLVALGGYSWQARGTIWDAGDRTWICSWSSTTTPYCCAIASAPHFQFSGAFFPPYPQCNAEGSTTSVWVPVPCRGCWAGCFDSCKCVYARVCVCVWRWLAQVLFLLYGPTSHLLLDRELRKKVLS